jgi:dolichyl-phosphate beta-glucosyltransferase
VTAPAAAVHTSTPGNARPSLTIVLPAYNESQRIGPALDELFGYLHRGGKAREGGRSPDELGPWDVLVVDDGSVDNTAELVEARPEARADDRPGAPAAQLRVLRIPHEGKGGAVRAGMLAATGDLVIFTDADLATPPDQIPLLTEQLATHDVALGSRVLPDGSDRRASQPLYRRALGRLFHALAAAWVTGPVADTQCGFKGFRRAVAADLFARQRITSIVFDAEIIHLARRQGYSIAVMPVQWSDKRGSRMALRPRLAARVGWDLFRIPFLHGRWISRPGPGPGILGRFLTGSSAWREDPGRLRGALGEPLKVPPGAGVGAQHGDQRHQDAQDVEPEHGHRDDRPDRDGPAPLGVGAPGDERDGEREPQEERDGQMVAQLRVATRIQHGDPQPFVPEPGHGKVGDAG